MNTSFHCIKPSHCERVFLFNFVMLDQRNAYLGSHNGPTIYSFKKYFIVDLVSLKSRCVCDNLLYLHWCQFCVQSAGKSQVEEEIRNRLSEPVNQEQLLLNFSFYKVTMNFMVNLSHLSGLFFMSSVIIILYICLFIWFAFEWMFWKLELSLWLERLSY